MRAGPDSRFRPDHLLFTLNPENPVRGTGAVLAIRGTLSLEDVLTDFLCEPADVEEWIVSAKPGALSELSRDPHGGKPGKLRIPLLSSSNAGVVPHIHTPTHARTHTRMHARTHTHDTLRHAHTFRHLSVSAASSCSSKHQVVGMLAFMKQGMSAALTLQS